MYYPLGKLFTFLKGIDTSIFAPSDLPVSYRSPLKLPSTIGFNMYFVNLHLGVHSTKFQNEVDDASDNLLAKSLNFKYSSELLHSSKSGTTLPK